MYKFLDEGVHAEVLDFPGAISCGTDLQDARRMLSAALVDMAETNLLRGEPLPHPDPEATAGVITEFPVPTASSGLCDIVAGPDGKLWFAERDANQIGNITTAGVVTEFTIPTANTWPGSIATGSDGNLWFTEELVNRIGRITTAGVVTEFPIAGGGTPFTIAAGSDGNLWVTEQNGNSIRRVTTAGVMTRFFIPTPNSLPRGIAAGPDGNLWFVERGSNKVGRITTGPLFDLGLTVDSAGNGVFDPGETATVAPTWKNNGGSSIARTGTASNFAGPAGPTYTITDATADYGTIAAGGSANCQTATGDCYGLSVTGTRPAQHWDTTFQETMSDGTEKVWTLHIGDSFTDVSPWGFYRFIETIFHNGVTGGCGGTNYCPTANVTRQQMAVFLLVSKLGSSYSPPACTVPVFADVPCSSGFARWINDLAARGVTGGCGGGNYCPTDPATRAQMAVFLLRTKEGPSYTPPACTTPMFTDVPCSNGFAPWINELANRGITGGCGGGNYCPDSPNTRGQMAVFLTTTFALQLYAK
jgi:streptogramin lyase